MRDPNQIAGEIIDRWLASVATTAPRGNAPLMQEMIAEALSSERAETKACRLAMVAARRDAEEARSRYDLLTVDFGEYRDRIRAKQIAAFRHAALRAIEAARECPESADDVIVPRKWVEIMRGILAASPDGEASETPATGVGNADCLDCGHARSMHAEQFKGCMACTCTALEF